MEFKILKLSSVMTAVLTLLASSCCYSFVDRRPPTSPPGEGDVTIDYRQRLHGMLQHVWYAEQIRMEQAQLAILRAQRKALESTLQQRKCVTAPFAADQASAGVLSTPQPDSISGVHQ
ncbi:hypothetical protein CR62_03830 [Serratia grimesii]|jgi:hypothetical protein|uniref:Lipoprotein n=1 Tax=Serratia grimesii TaxID=82995 RepID=A0ABR4U968_9GAMM|nr:hypothetical protein CR62_03830 [Serratia grimesii]